MIGRERRRRRRETRVQPPLETGHWRRTQRPIPWRLRVIALDLACTCTIHGVARSLWRGGEQRFVGLSRGRVMPSWETWPLGGDAISLRSAIPGREEMERTRLFEMSKDRFGKVLTSFSFPFAPRERNSSKVMLCSRVTILPGAKLGYDFFPFSSSPVFLF